MWHVTNRGVEQRSTFQDDCDRTRFLELLAMVVHRYRWRLHAYTLMTNHFHLQIATPIPTLSRGMQKLEGDYVEGFNKRHTRRGHLFEGRFRAELIDSEEYLLRVARYIVLNPVRAGMVESAGDWPWSSYRATAGLEPPPKWLDTWPILERCHPDDAVKAAAYYRDYVAAGVNQPSSPWENLVARQFLGGPQFIAKVSELLKSREWKAENSKQQQNVRAIAAAEVARAVEAHTCVDLTERRRRGDSSRMAFVLLARDEAIARLSEIGTILQMSVTGTESLLRRAERRVKKDEAFQSLVEMLRQKLSRAE